MFGRIRFVSKFLIVAVLAAFLGPALASAQSNCQIYWQNATSMPVEAGSSLPLTYRTQGCTSAQDIRLVHGETELGRANGTLDIHFTIPQEAGPYGICPQLLINGTWATVDNRCIELKVENHQAVQATSVVAPSMTLAANAQQANAAQSTPVPQQTLSLTDTNQGGGTSNKTITTVTVKVWKLNVRQDADKNSALMGAVYPKDILTYNFSNSDGTWFNITAPNGLTGWVMSKFVKGSGAEIRQTPTQAPQAVTTATEVVGQSYLNVGLLLTDIPKDAKFVFAPKDVLIRKGPGEAFPVIAQVSAGYYLLWKNQVGSWIQVAIPNSTGWVSAWSTNVASNDGKQTMVPNPTAVPTAQPTAAFSPTPEFANDGTCGSAPTANLLIGKKGQSTPQGGNINVRDNPAGNKLGWQIGELAVFDVVDGPACSQNFWWWQVSYKGQTGWIAAGDSVNGAYVVPVG